MKVSNIIKRLENIEATDINVDVEKTVWGHQVRMTAKIGGYYDFELTNQIRDREHIMSDGVVKSFFFTSDVMDFATKPYHDQSDPMTDYCAWSFHYTINALDRKAESAKARNV